MYACVVGVRRKDRERESMVFWYRKIEEIVSCDRIEVDLIK